MISKDELKNVENRIVSEILKGKESINYDKEINKDDENMPGSYAKIVGNLNTMTLRKYISSILNYYGLDFKVSNCNAFIKGCPIEWDLLVLKDTAIDINNTNVFNPDDVICVFEFKTSGLMRTTFNNIEDAFKRQFEWIKKFRKDVNRKIPFGYISFSESYSRKRDIYDGIIEYFERINNLKNIVYVFLDYDSLAKNEIKYINKDNDFEEYLLNLINIGSKRI